MMSKYSYDQRRGTRHQRGYTNRWDRAAKRFLAGNPRCAMCNGIATLVDHMKPHNNDTRLFWDERNWQPLCHSCHNAKTAADKMGKPVRITGTDGWPVGE